MTASVIERSHPAVVSPPTAAPADRLAGHGELLAAWLARSGRVPLRWQSGGFARTVDLVRIHLGPINSRELLAHSYGREHFQLIGVGKALTPQALLAHDATEVAYALRWLELGGFVSRPWSSLLAAETVADPEC